MNILILDPKTVCVEASEKEQMEQFDKLGFEVIPVPFWDVAAFGGGLHCATADVYREGTWEDYFPQPDPGLLDPRLTPDGLVLPQQEIRAAFLEAARISCLNPAIFPAPSPPRRT